MSSENHLSQSVMKSSNLIDIFKAVNLSSMQKKIRFLENVKNARIRLLGDYPNPYQNLALQTRPTSEEVNLIDKLVIDIYDSLSSFDNKSGNRETFRYFFTDLLNWMPISTKVIDHIGVDLIYSIWHEYHGSQLRVFKNLIFSMEILGGKYKRLFPDKREYFQFGIFPVTSETFIMENKEIPADVIKKGRNVIWSEDLIILIIEYQKKHTKPENWRKELGYFFYGVENCKWRLEWLIVLAKEINIGPIISKAEFVDYSTQDVIRLQNELVENDLFNLCSLLYVNSNNFRKIHLKLSWDISSLTQIEHLIEWDGVFNFDITKEIFERFYHSWNFKSLSKSSIVLDSKIFQTHIKKWDWNLLGENPAFQLNPEYLDYLIAQSTSEQIPMHFLDKILSMSWDERLLRIYKNVLIKSSFFRDVLKLPLMLSAEFIIQNEEYFTWRGKSDYWKKSSDQWENYWISAPTATNKLLDLPVAIIEKHSRDWESEIMYHPYNTSWHTHDGGAWACYSQNKYITREHLRCFKEKIRWDILIIENKSVCFDFDLVEEFKEYISWDYIFEREELSWTANELIEYFDFINWNIALDKEDIFKIVKYNSILNALVYVLDELSPFLDSIEKR